MSNCEEINKLALNVLKLSRNTLVVNLRFMDMAISMLEFVPAAGADVAVDGEHILYDPVWLLKQYVACKELPTRAYLHMVFHCVFRHSFVHELVNRKAWDTACDIVVESVINELNINCVKVPNEQKQEPVIAKLKEEFKVITAEKLYGMFIDKNYSDYQLDVIRNAFALDNHEIWYQKDNQNDGDGGSDGKSDGDNDNNQSDSQQSGGGNGKDDSPLDGDGGSDGKSDGDNDNNQSDSQQGGGGGNGKGDSPHDGDGGSDGKSDGDNGNNQSDSQQGGGGNGKDDSPPSDSDRESGNNDLHNRQKDDSLEEEWKNIAERLKTDLETFSKERGDIAGCMMQNIAEVTREKYDYSDFLRRFAVMNEVMKVNDDEFDYIFYTYGMKMFGKMPLIEPLEYKDEKRVKEFVIAIDTSGSVQGDLVNTFLKKTYNILKQQETMATKINVHIVQCDARVQHDEKITNQEEFDKYIKNMKLFGFGGTDFRPVFKYVDELIDNKEFANLKGMIYFTDGKGVYPEKKPRYETAFVFIEDDYSDVEVPAWAIKLILKAKEI